MELLCILSFDTKSRQEFLYSFNMVSKWKLDFVKKLAKTWLMGGMKCDFIWGDPAIQAHVSKLSCLYGCGSAPLGRDYS